MSSIFDHRTAALARTEPGPGGADDGGMVKTKSIPRVGSARLRRCLDQLHGECHTMAGLRAHDAPRRALVEKCVKAQIIAKELLLRGEPVECRSCRPPEKS